MKYNDLLNKHLYLAAQKTEDNTSQKFTVKSTSGKAYLKHGDVKKAKVAIKFKDDFVANSNHP